MSISCAITSLRHSTRITCIQNTVFVHKSSALGLLNDGRPRIGSIRTSTSLSHVHAFVISTSATDEEVIVECCSLDLCELIDQFNLGGDWFIDIETTSLSWYKIAEAIVIEIRWDLAQEITQAFNSFKTPESSISLSEALTSQYVSWYPQRSPVVFMNLSDKQVSYPLQIQLNDNTKHINAACNIAIITKKTIILVVSRPFVFEPKWKDEYRVYRCESLASLDLLSLEDEDLQRSLDGIIFSFLVDLNKNQSSLLLLGPSGSSPLCVLFSSIQRQRRLGLYILHLSPYISSRGGQLNLGSCLERACRCAVAMTAARPENRCILVLEDIHAMLSSSNTDEELTNENNLNDLLVNILRSSSMSGVMIVGCGLENCLQSAASRAFREVIHVTSPSSRRRAALVDDHIKIDSETTRRFLRRAAEGLSGVPAYPLLLQLRSLSSNDPRPADEDSDSANEDLTFEGVAGLESVKQQLIEILVWPQKYPQIFRMFDQRSPVGILLYGPPGTGKTLLPRVLARELNRPLIALHLTQVVRGEVGTGERNLRKCFRDAQASAPSLVFIDEFQAIFSTRDKAEKDGAGSTLTAALASCLDDISVWNHNCGAEALVLVLAATNEPWAIDRSFLRAGRFDHPIFVGTLSTNGRLEFMRREVLRRFPCADLSGEDLDVTRTEGLTGADMALLVKRASRQQKSMKTVRDFIESIRLSSERSEPSVSEEEIEEYLDFQSSLDKR